MSTKPGGQLSLLRKKRFAPLFLTQFFGALNDNVFKNSLFLIIAYQSTALMSSEILINIAAILFILPFFLFSSLAGQIADKFEKSKLIRRIKLFEIVFMVFAAAAFYLNSVVGLLVLLFLMGTQSAFFGPIKYSILPQQLNDDELVGGNALVGMGTFSAILLGTITAGLLIQYTGHGILGIAVIAIALTGWISSRFIPKASASSPHLNISYNLFSQSWKIIQSARNNRPVFLSILAVSWFWFLGAAYITHFPIYTLNILHGSEGVVTFLLASFSIGIGLGSMLCERLSDKKVELGLVPLGALGLTLFGIDLCFAYPAHSGAEALSLMAFIKSTGGLHVMVDVICIGFFGGLYTVPLYAFIQTNTNSSKRARVIAVGNILNALLMVFAGISGAVILGLMGLSVIHYFLTIAILNLLVTLYIFSVVPEFFMRFIAWLLSRVMYRTRIEGLSNLPDKGPAVIVCNHVSFVDWLLISSACRRPIRFVMYEPIYRIPVLHFIFKAAKAIPINSKKLSPKNYRRAFNEIKNTLDKSEILCLFPEGKLTTNGEIDEFKRGVEKIVKTNPVPVIPMAIEGMWGSFFSRKNGRALTSFPKRFWSRVKLNIGMPVVPEFFNLQLVREQVILLKEQS